MTMSMTMSVTMTMCAYTVALYSIRHRVRVAVGRAVVGRDHRRRAVHRRGVLQHAGRVGGIQPDHVAALGLGTSWTNTRRRWQFSWGMMGATRRVSPHRPRAEGPFRLCSTLNATKSGWRLGANQ